MRICIFGAGAVGGHLAVRLRRSGHDVSVVARGDNLAAIRAHGLTLRAGGDTLHADVKASDRPAALGTQDIVISTLKANALSGLASGVGPLLGPETTVVFAQNGIPWWYGIGLSSSRPATPDLSRLDRNGALHKAIDPVRVIGAVIHSSNELIAPGIIVNDSPQRNVLVVGEADDRQSERVAALRSALVGSDIESPLISDIRQAIWRKLVINMTGSILCLLTGQRATIVRDDVRIGDLFMRSVREAIAIANAHGIDLGGFDPEDFCRSPPDHLPSIRQDFDRARQLELDSLLVMPVAFGKAASIDTPCLDAMLALAVRQGLDRGLYIS